MKLGSEEQESAIYFIRSLVSRLEEILLGIEGCLSTDDSYACLHILLTNLHTTAVFV